MKKNIIKIAVWLIPALMLSCPVFAADFSKMNNDELYGISKNIAKLSAQEQNEFRLEWQHRIQTMTQEELRKYDVESVKCDGTAIRERKHDRLNTRDRIGNTTRTSSGGVSKQTGKN